MTSSFELSATVRTDKGKGASRRLRRLNDLVPAVIYGAGKEPASITLEHRKVVKALESEAFYTQIINIDLDGKKEKVVVKDIQRHPFKALILHLDFLRIKAGEKVTMHMPLHFIGETTAPGVKTGGGIISHLVTEVEVACLPENLPEYIEVDVSKLELDDVLHLSEISAPKGVVFTALEQEHPNDLAVVSIHKPRGAAQMEDQEIPEQERDDADENDSRDKK